MESQVLPVEVRTPPPIPKADVGRAVSGQTADLSSLQDGLAGFLFHQPRPPETPAFSQVVTPVPGGSVAELAARVGSDNILPNVTDAGETRGVGEARPIVGADGRVPTPQGGGILGADAPAIHHGLEQYARKERPQTVFLPNGTFAYRDPGNPDESREVRINDVGRVLTNLHAFDHENGRTSQEAEELARQRRYITAVNQGVLPHLLGMTRPFHELTPTQQQDVYAVSNQIIANFNGSARLLLDDRKAEGEPLLLGREIGRENMGGILVQHRLVTQIFNSPDYQRYPQSKFAGLQREEQRAVFYLMDNYRRIIEQPQFVRIMRDGGQMLSTEHMPVILPDVTDPHDIGDFLNFYRNTKTRNQGNTQLQSLLKIATSGKGAGKGFHDHPFIAMSDRGVTERQWVSRVLAGEGNLTDSNPFVGGPVRLDALPKLPGGVQRQTTKEHMAERFTFLSFTSHANPLEDTVALLLPEEFCTPQIMEFFTGAESSRYNNIMVIPLDGSVDVADAYTNFYYHSRNTFHLEPSPSAVHDPYATPDFQNYAQNEAPTMVDGIPIVHDSLDRRMEHDKLLFREQAEVRRLLHQTNGNPIALARLLVNAADTRRLQEELVVDPRPEVNARLSRRNEVLAQAMRNLRRVEDLLGVQRDEMVPANSGATRGVGSGEVNPASVGETQISADQAQVVLPEAQSSSEQQALHDRLRGKDGWLQAFASLEGGDVYSTKDMQQAIFDLIPPHWRHLPEYFRLQPEWELPQQPGQKKK